MVLTDEEFRNSSKEDLAEICDDDWKLHVEYDLVFSDLRTNEIYVSVGLSNVSLPHALSTCVLLNAFAF
jgi:hypothetical protein